MSAENAHPSAAFGFGGDRPQEIRTPLTLIRTVEKAFGGVIALDPCAPTHAPPTFAALRYVREAENGLRVEWVDRTFFNPPYDDLKPWLAKAREAGSRGLRVVALVPLRSHRKWFRAAMVSATRIVYLDAVKFEGYKSAFPVPLVLLCWNCEVDGPTIGACVNGDYT